MKFHKYSTLPEALESLKKRGFVKNYKFENNALKCLETGKIYESKELRIVEYHRFEKNNPSDISVVFAIICSDGPKGTVVYSNDTYANLPLIVFIDKVKIADRTKAA